MRREAARINAEDLAPEDAAWSAMVADARLAVALLRASTLPMLYPGGVLFVCWEGIRDL
jgi:ABC-type dipeptide/oligopeptide/nickel transport system permease subunit